MKFDSKLAKRFLGAFIVLGILAHYSCKDEVEVEDSVEVESIPSISYEFSTSYPHDTTAFTEGLLMHEGKLFESTGATEQFPQTKSLFGMVDLASGKISPKAQLDGAVYFGEGICHLNDKWYQLTYKSRKGFVYDANYNKIGEFQIPSLEGWGMTTDGKELIMSDGSSKLTYLNPESLKVTKEVPVTEYGYPIEKLNELEYIDGYIYANVWMTNTVIKIEPSSGEVVGKMDLSAYAQDAGQIYPMAQEMNGIAYNPETKKFLFTGKLWPKIYEIDLE